MMQLIFWLRQEQYYPIKKELITEKLESMGYTKIELMCFQAYFNMPEFERAEWYCIMERKIS